MTAPRTTVEVRASGESWSKDRCGTIYTFAADAFVAGYRAALEDAAKLICPRYCAHGKPIIINEKGKRMHLSEDSFLVNCKASAIHAALAAEADKGKER